MKIIDSIKNKKIDKKLILNLSNKYYNIDDIYDYDIFHIENRIILKLITKSNLFKMKCIYILENNKLYDFINSELRKMKIQSII